MMHGSLYGKRCRWWLGDGKVIDGGVISSIMISDMVASNRGDIGNGRMTSDVVVAGTIISDIMNSRRGDISDDSVVTCGDGRLVDSGVVSSVVT